MAIEIAGAVASVRLLWDVVKANKSFVNYNELVAAVSEVNTDLIAAQSAAITSQKSELALSQRVRELEQKIVALENWKREAKRYELCSVIMGFSAYRLKPKVEHREPLHYLCANCFADKKKSILQFSVAAGYENYVECPRCMSKRMFDHTDIAHHFPDFYEKQRARMLPTE